MDIIKIILNLVFSLFGNNRITPKKDKTPEDLEAYYNKNLFLKAKEEFLINEDAYYPGKVVWSSGTYKKKNYNNILYVKASGPVYLEIYRKYTKKCFRLIGREEITKINYDKAVKKLKISTWCNVASGIFTKFYIGFNIQWTDKERSANNLIKHMKVGGYDSDDFKFVKCSQKDGRKYAYNGGLCFATWINPVGSGHIATLTGIKRFTGNESQPEIIQAGKTTGLMTLTEGFGRLKKINYYKLIRKI